MFIEKTNREYLEYKKFSNDNYEEKLQENYLQNFPNFLDGINVILRSQIYSDKISISNDSKVSNFYITGTGVNGIKYMLIKINLLQNEFTDKEVLNKYLLNLQTFSLREQPTSKNFLKYYGLIFDEQSQEEFNHYLVFEMPKYNLEDFLMTQFSSLPSCDKFLILKEILETLKSLYENRENNPLATNLKFYFLDENIITLSTGNREKIYTFKFLNLGQILKLDAKFNFKCSKSINKCSKYLIDIPNVKDIFQSALLEQCEIFKIQTNLFYLLEHHYKQSDKFSLSNLNEYENEIISKYYLFAFCNLIHIVLSKNYYKFNENSNDLNSYYSLVSNYKNSSSIGQTKVQTISSEISLSLKTFLIVNSKIDESSKTDVLVGDKMQQAWKDFNDSIENYVKTKISSLTLSDYISQLSKLEKNIFKLKVKKIELCNKEYSVEEINLLDSQQNEKEVDFDGYSIIEIKQPKLFINNKRSRIENYCENNTNVNIKEKNIPKLKKINTKIKNNIQIVDLTNESQLKEFEVSNASNYLKKRNVASGINHTYLNNSLPGINKSDLNRINSTSKSFSKEGDNIVISLLEDTAHVLMCDNSTYNSKNINRSKCESIKNEVSINEISGYNFNQSGYSKLEFEFADQNLNCEKFEFMMKHFTFNNYDSWITGSMRKEKINGAISIHLLPKLGEIGLNEEKSVLKFQPKSNKNLSTANIEKENKISNIIQSNCNININVTNYYLNNVSNCPNNFQTSSCEIIEKNLGENLMCQISKVVVLPNRPMEKHWNPSRILREDYSNIGLLDTFGKIFK